MMRPAKRRALAMIATLFILGLFADSGPLLLGGDDAHAVVGRPATPVSYAGVARRTSRRTTAAVATTATVASGTVTTLPTGCAFAGGIYTCGAVRYRPYYDGPTVVYRAL